MSQYTNAAFEGPRTTTASVRGDPVQLQSQNRQQLQLQQLQQRQGQRQDTEKHDRTIRTACDFFIIISLLASIAFIIVGLTTSLWIFYAPSNIVTYSSRGVFTYCGVNQTTACSALDLGQSSNVNDVQYWNIIAMRRTVIACLIIAVIFAGCAVLVHIFCCAPSCRRRYKHGFWKNSIASGILDAFAAAFQLCAMIIFQVGVYYEAIYSGLNCYDCYSLWPASVKSQTSISYGVSYALGWSAAGLLTYVAYAYLSREVCIVSKCRPSPIEESEDEQNLDAISGVSSSTPYIKGTARDLQFGQIYNAPRLQRYDAATLRAQPTYYAELY